MSQSGTYTLIYQHTDAAGNTGSATRTVNVVSSITLASAASGTGSALVSSGNVQPGTLVVTNGNVINTTSTEGFLNIPGTVNFILSGAVWNGILYAPTLSTGSTLAIGDAGVVVNLPQDTPTTDYTYTVLPTLMVWGTGGTSIVANGGLFTLSMKINSPSVSSGTSLPIFRSNDSVTWTLNTPTSSCILDSNLMCTFTTDHLSYFGFVRVTSTPIVAVAPQSITRGPGWAASAGVAANIYLADIPMTKTVNTYLSDFLVPSIMNLLYKWDATVSRTQSTGFHRVTNPITDYICPVVEQVYSVEDVSKNAWEGSFKSDVQSLLMYRALDNSDEKLSLNYILDQSSGIASNNAKFRGNLPITRAEFVKMLVRSLSCHYEFIGNDSGFSDVGTDMWYAEYITFATKNGWIKGYSNGTFLPNNPITRWEASKILAQAIHLKTRANNVVSFSDIPNTNDFAPYIYALRKYAIIGWKTPNYFDMNSSISRNEVAKIINKTFLSIGK